GEDPRPVPPARPAYGGGGGGDGVVAHRRRIWSAGWLSVLNPHPCHTSAAMESAPRSLPWTRTTSLPPRLTQASRSALSLSPSRHDRTNLGSRSRATSSAHRCSSLLLVSYSAATSRSQLRVSLSVSNASSFVFAAHQSAVSLSASACALRTSACTRGRIAAAYRCAHLSVVIAVGVRSVVMA